tara:strand:- start:424 stop:843 length:420 start_codon:yes stop_codon:yes gene_type:complete
MNCANIFDWLKHINQYKTPVEKFTDKDWDVFNSYMIHRFLSMNRDFLEIVNFVQDYPPQEKKSIYSIYREYIPKNNKWNKYIKSTKKQPNNDLVQIISDYYVCSKKEAKEYLNILDNQSVVSILNQLGVENKDQKQLLK